MDFTEIENFYEKHELNTTETWYKNYFSPIKRLFEGVVEVPGFKGNQTNFIKYINEKYTTDATRNYYLRAYLWFLVNYAKAPDVKRVDDALNASNIARIQNKVVPANIPIEDIETAIIKEYGVGSIQDIFIQVFQAVPSRLDYLDIKLDNFYAEKNYNTETGILEMRNYTKTKKKETKSVKQSATLQALIKKSIAEDPREDLIVFSNKDLSKAVRNILEKSGFPGSSMNTLRHSMASPDMTPEARAKLSTLMGHRGETSLSYKRPLSITN